MALTKDMLKQIRSLFTDGIELPGLGGMGVIRADKLSSDFEHGDECDSLVFLKGARPKIEVVIHGEVTGAQVYDDKIIVKLSGIPFKSSHTIEAE